MQLPQDKLIALAKEGAASSGLPASLVYAMIMAESTGKPGAVHKDSGALGLMQLMPDTAESMGFTPEEMTNPSTNVKAGSGYMAQMLARFKDPQQALSAYNAGPTATRRAEHSFPRVTDVVPATIPYIGTVSDTVSDVIQPGQPFAEEANPPLPSRVGATARVADLIAELTGAPSATPRFNQDGIRRMLSQFDFNQ
jgi:hypothetical protein